MNRPHIYIECEIPEGVTLTDWRRSENARIVRRPSLWRRLRTRG
jgi:hypothetical protein